MESKPIDMLSQEQLQALATLKIYLEIFNEEQIIDPSNRNVLNNLRLQLNGIPQAIIQEYVTGLHLQLPTLNAAQILLRFEVLQAQFRIFENDAVETRGPRRGLLSRVGSGLASGARYIPGVSYFVGRSNSGSSLAASNDVPLVKSNATESATTSTTTPKTSTTTASEPKIIKNYTAEEAEKLKQKEAQEQSAKAERMAKEQAAKEAQEIADREKAEKEAKANADWEAQKARIVGKDEKTIEREKADLLHRQQVEWDAEKARVVGKTEKQAAQEEASRLHAQAEAEMAAANPVATQQPVQQPQPNAMPQPNVVPQVQAQQEADQPSPAPAQEPIMEPGSPPRTEPEEGISDAQRRLNELNARLAESRRQEELLRRQNAENEASSPVRRALRFRAMPAVSPLPAPPVVQQAVVQPPAPKRSGPTDQEVRDFFG